MTYEVEFAKSAQKEMRKLTPATATRVAAAIGQLCHSPRKGSVRPMVGSTSWRLRVGDYRVIYDIHDKKLVILVIKIKHRREVYR
jgi:mRNA interferase RelE/StbE